MSGRRKHGGVPGSGRFRIIAGRWRGRRLEFPDTGRLRPTPDRVRETLFNWLSRAIEGARCLDLYAGSGALGLEALSRGAGGCVFVERDGRALDAIRAHCERLEATGAETVGGDALAFLRGSGRRFDVIFLDPPFDAQPWADLLGTIVERQLLLPGGQIYLETLASAGVPELPEGLLLARSKKAGRVGYHLVTTAGESQ